MANQSDRKLLSLIRKENSTTVFYYTVRGSNDQISRSDQILSSELKLVQDSNGKFVDTVLPTRDFFSVRLPRDDTCEIVKNGTYIIYRGNKGEKKIYGYDDETYEQLVIITSEGRVYSEALYGQPSTTLNVTDTVADSQIFDVYLGTGKFKKSSQILGEYDNDLTKSFTPEAIKNEVGIGGLPLKFRRVTVNIF
jgi:hypothetical protein